MDPTIKARGSFVDILDEDLKDVSALVVDSKAHNSKILCTMLSTIGLTRIVVVQDAANALDLLRTEKFDVVFADESSTGMNPIVFTKMLRRDPHTADNMLPIVFMSSCARRRQIELARDAGANDVIVRPVSVETVRRKLRSTMRPRPFIAAEDFLGPDRRRAGPLRGGYIGEDRRTQDPRRVRLGAKARKVVEAVENPDSIEV